MFFCVGEGTRPDLPPPPIPAKPRILASANVGQLQPGLGNNDRKTIMPSTNEAPQVPKMVVFILIGLHALKQGEPSPP